MPAWTAASWLGLGILAVISTVVAFLIFFWAVRSFGPSRGALISYLAPVAGLLLAFAVLGERPLPLQLVGAVVVLVGVRLVVGRTAMVASSTRPSPA